MYVLARFALSQYQASSMIGAYLLHDSEFAFAKCDVSSALVFNKFNLNLSTAILSLVLLLLV